MNEPLAASMRLTAINKRELTAVEQMTSHIQQNGFKADAAILVSSLLRLMTTGQACGHYCSYFKCMLGCGFLVSVIKRNQTSPTGSLKCENDHYFESVMAYIDLQFIMAMLSIHNF